MNKTAVIALVSVFLAGSILPAEAAKKQTKKLSRSEAKSQCLSDDPGLQGRSLKTCIKKKLRASR